MNLSRRKSCTSATARSAAAGVFSSLSALVAAPLGAEDLALDLLDLDGQHLRLVDPLVEPALPAERWSESSPAVMLSISAKLLMIRAIASSASPILVPSGIRVDRHRRCRRSPRRREPGRGISRSASPMPSIDVGGAAQSDSADWSGPGTGSRRRSGRWPALIRPLVVDEVGLADRLGLSAAPRPASRRRATGLSCASRPSVSNSRSWPARSEARYSASPFSKAASSALPSCSALRGVVLRLLDQEQ